MECDSPENHDKYKKQWYVFICVSITAYFAGLIAIITGRYLNRIFIEHRKHSAVAADQGYYLQLKEFAASMETGNWLGTLLVRSHQFFWDHPQTDSEPRTKMERIHEKLKEILIVRRSPPLSCAGVEQKMSNLNICVVYIYL